MKKITITLTDESKRPLLEALFDSLDFISYEEELEFDDFSAFEESFGLWKNTEIDLEIIRSRAWRQTG